MSSHHAESAHNNISPTPVKKMTRDEIMTELHNLVAEAIDQCADGYAVDVEAEYDALADKLWEQIR